MKYIGKKDCFFSQTLIPISPNKTVHTLSSHTVGPTSFWQSVPQGPSWAVSAPSRSVGGKKPIAILTFLRPNFFLHSKPVKQAKWDKPLGACWPEAAVKFRPLWPAASSEPDPRPGTARVKHSTQKSTVCQRSPLEMMILLQSNYYYFYCHCFIHIQA